MKRPVVSNKAKIARRVIEVLEYFAAERKPAKVTEIADHCLRPQSSTSELLGSLVELGILYRDCETRTYVPTPRIAALGLGLQPEPIANGRLFDLMDRLAQTTRCGVGLFDMVGTRVQIVRWSGERGCSPKSLVSGASMPLCSSVAGQLLMSTLRSGQVRGLLWRLKSEVTPGAQFDLEEVDQAIMNFAQSGNATGIAGFAPSKQMTAVLLSQGFGQRPLALGVAYCNGAAIDAEALVATLDHGISNCLLGDVPVEKQFIRTIAAV